MDIKRDIPKSVGMDSKAINDFINELIDDELQDLHTITIYKDEKVIYENQILPYSLDIAKSVFSLSKTFVTLAVGFAIDEKIIKLDDFIVDIFKEYLPDNIDDRLNDVTIYDCLTMTNGHGSDNREKFINSKQVTILQDILSLKLDNNPKEKFCYNSVASYLLAAAICIKSNCNLTDYLNERLYKPLDIKTPYWQKTPNKIEYGAYGIKVTPEDLLKIGILILNDGIYQGKQYISKEYMLKAKSKLVESNGHSKDWCVGYGLHIWQCQHNWIRTDGFMGQYLLISKEYNTIIVITAATDKMNRTLEILYRYIPKLFNNKNNINECKLELKKSVLPKIF